MKRKWPVILAVILIVTAFMATAAFASSSSTQQEGTAEKPSLTDEQKVEVKGILAQIQALKEQLIDKYAGYGILSQEKADAMKERMQERAAKAEEKGYLPAFGRFGGMMGGKGGPRGGRCGGGYPRFAEGSGSTETPSAGE